MTASRQESDALELVIAEITDAAGKIYVLMKPGHPKPVYDACMTHELGRRGLEVRSAVPLPVPTPVGAMQTGLTLDFVVASRVVVEVVAAHDISPVFEHQLRTCLRLSGLPAALLVHFGAAGVEEVVWRVRP